MQQGSLCYGGNDTAAVVTGARGVCDVDCLLSLPGVPWGGAQRPLCGGSGATSVFTTGGCVWTHGCVLQLKFSSLDVRQG